VLPSAEYPIFDIPLNHPIMHTLYDVKDYLQVSSINFWSRSNGDVSERGADSAQVHYRGIQDSKGRLMVMMTHNTDVADTWEREGESQQYFDLFSPRGYAIGVNVVLYAMTHCISRCDSPDLIRIPIAVRLWRCEARRSLSQKRSPRN
jgi:hypothetical protein